MAVVTVPDNELVVTPADNSFDVWRQKTNILAARQGIIGDLQTTVKTDLVSAINESLGTLEEQDRGILIRSIAMS